VGPPRYDVHIQLQIYMGLCLSLLFANGECFNQDASRLQAHARVHE